MSVPNCAWIEELIGCILADRRKRLRIRHSIIPGTRPER
jgi:hypothetical protein